MNHIDTLRARIDQLEAERDALLNGLHSVRSYAQSPKFLGLTPTMNPLDIVLRVNEVLDNHIDITLVPYGAACNVQYASEVRARGFINVVSPGDGRWGEYRRGDAFRRSHPETFAERPRYAYNICQHGYAETHCNSQARPIGEYEGTMPGRLRRYDEVQS